MKQSDDESPTIIDGNFKNLVSPESTGRWEFGDIATPQDDLTFSSELTSEEFRKQLKEYEAQQKKTHKGTGGASNGLLKLFAASTLFAAATVVGLFYLSTRHNTLDKSSGLGSNELTATSSAFAERAALSVKGEDSGPSVSRPGDSALGAAIANSIVKNDPTRGSQPDSPTNERLSSESQPVLPTADHLSAVATNDAISNPLPADDLKARASLAQPAAKERSPANIVKKPRVPQYTSIRAAKTAYRAGKMTRAQYRKTISALEAEFDRNVALLKSRYRAGKISRRAYKERVAVLKRRLRG